MKEKEKKRKREREREREEKEREEKERVEWLTQEKGIVFNFINIFIVMIMTVRE